MNIEGLKETFKTYVENFDMSENDELCRYPGGSNAGYMKTSPPFLFRCDDKKAPVRGASLSCKLSFFLFSFDCKDKQIRYGQ